MSLTIHLNGNERVVPASTTVQSLLEILGMANVPVLVEHNATALFPREFASTSLAAGDRVEVIRIVAGG